MRQLRCLEFFVAVILLLPAFASAQDAAPAAPAAPAAAAPKPEAPKTTAAPAAALPGHFAEERRSVTSEVMAIDLAARTITLREEGEEPQSYIVEKEVRNLDQVKVGDRVKVDTYESTSIKTLPPGELGDEEKANVTRSEPSEKPGGVATRTRTITVKISSVFPDSKEFLTRNAKGQLRTWKVSDPKELENLKSGDRIQLTSVSSLAVSVTPAPPEAVPAAATKAPDATNAPPADSSKTPAAEPAKTPPADSSKTPAAEPAKTPAAEPAK